jgi:hypothetical protein
VYDTVDIFNGAASTWSVAKLSAARSFLSSTSIADQGLAMVGGGELSDGQEASDIVDIFNGILGTWSVQHLSQGREALTAASLPDQNLAFFAGGDDSNAGVALCMSYFLLRFQLLTI